MNDAMLRLFTRVKVGATSRLLRGDRGQTAVEYLGIIVVVVAIVVAITGTDIGTSIMNAIRQKISDLTGD
ncbi:Flp family type IVb pilin [Streptomyces nymphaeiformis]|uniref:Pilus assembly protein Flp/PilA n=1 Tax=Streptomyces nymphaeiformis TaxID=2663842 RepID=A0A7W7U283_9ACTN|nr:Flp family type IVb pilin [Streptomyces nymphaeiformis]MBB4983321.1 pilus assembly protein Flp/PilA [Streptomyces nymphaeiformis]